MHQVEKLYAFAWNFALLMLARRRSFLDLGSESTERLRSVYLALVVEV